MHFGISESISHWGKYSPTKPALCHNGKVATFRELNSFVDGLANHIGELKLGVDRIGITVKSKYHYLISLLSILRAGKSVVLLNTGLSLDAIKTNIEDAEIQTLIYDNHHKHILDFLDSKNQENTVNIEQRIQCLQAVSDIPSLYRNRLPTDEWGVLFSSGTTGIPKGIVRDHYSIVIEMLGWCIELALNRGSTFYIGRPIFYTGGLVLSLSTLLVGGCIFINDYDDDDDNRVIWNDYQKELAHSSIDWAFFVPDQIRAFNKICENRAEKALGAKAILVMGAPITGEEKVKAVKLLNSQVVESWGNSESLGTITEPEDIDIRPDSIGRPFLSDELFIVDDDGNPLPAGQYGRLAGGEEASFNYYCNRPQETDHVKRNRLIISDDIGYMDQDGYFFIRGRDQDCVLVDKETIFLPEVEAKLKNNQYVEDCMVVAKSLDGSEFELICVLVPSKKAARDEEQLLNFLNISLKPKESLKRVYVIEALPRLPSGKVDKVAVKKLVGES